MPSGRKFLYFAYGSNLLTQRIHINNPTAVRHGIGKLQDYRLDFITYSSGWRGASATIVPTKGSSVWGAIWQIDIENMSNLDRQEGVAHKIYFPMDIDVCLSNGGVTKCRVYQQTATPEPYDSIKNLPPERRPSVAYLKTVKLGAAESGLPKEYQEFLEAIPDNGYAGGVDIDVKLDDTVL